MALKLGIIGTGSIARVIATAAKTVKEIEVVSVYSRSEYGAKKFVQELDMEKAEGFWDLDKFFLSSIDAVYVATPTATREHYCFQSIKFKKHILAEKPFLSHASTYRILDACQQNNLFMLDATHFVHNPRTNKVLKIMKNYSLGKLKHIRANFCFPLNDVNSNNFNVELEPRGVMGDLGWYPLRLAATLLPLDVTIVDHKVYFNSGLISHPPITTATGLILFSNNTSLAFQVSYENTCVNQTAEIVCEKGTLVINDYILPWKNSFVYGTHSKESTFDIYSGYRPLEQEQKIKVKNNGASQHEKMLIYFSRLILNKTPPSKQARLNKEMLKTMEFMDDISVKC